MKLQDILNKLSELESTELKVKFSKTEDGSVNINIREKTEPQIGNFPEIYLDGSGEYKKMYRESIRSRFQKAEAQWTEEGWVVKGDLDLSCCCIATLPKFVEVQSLDCSNNYLTSLEGLPRKIQGNLDISGNRLESLHNSPEEIEGDFDCSKNLLTNLLGAPLRVGRNFFCKGNKLIDLEGCPDYIPGIFDCSENEIVSLFGSPSRIGKDFICHHNRLPSLEGSPVQVLRNYMCYNNYLRSLKGTIKNRCFGHFNCSNNKLISLEECPPVIQGTFDCRNNQLTSLDNGPQKVEGDYYADGNPLEHVKGIRDVGGIIFHDLNK